MSDKSNKMAVLSVFGQKKGALPLSQILELLKPNCSERTVRRWLADLASQGVLEKLGKKKGMLYQLARPKNTCFSLQNEKIIAEVRQPLSSRKPVTYHTTWLNNYTPNKTTYVTDALKKELHHAGQKFKDNMPAGTYAREIYNRLLIDLSYNSSRLEGNTYSLIDTQRLILEGMTAPGKLDEETSMILNHKEAIRYLVDNAAKLTITPTEIYTVHFLLSEDLIATHYSGKVRDHGVRIGGSTYIPYENPAILEKQLTLICDKASQIIDPYEQSFFLLVHISYLQAFVDVNKRTARLSANIPLIKHNLIPLAFKDVDTNDYTSAMIAIYELNNTGPLLDIYRYSYLRTSEAYGVTVEAMGFDELRVKYRTQRRDILRHIITQQLTGLTMKTYIDATLEKLINEVDRRKVRDDIDEDLREIAPERIAGLGISIEELNAWLALNSKY